MYSTVDSGLTYTSRIVNKWMNTCHFRSFFVRLSARHRDKRSARKLHSEQHVNVRKWCVPDSALRVEHCQRIWVCERTPLCCRFSWVLQYQLYRLQLSETARWRLRWPNCLRDRICSCSVYVCLHWIFLECLVVDFRIIVSRPQRALSTATIRPSVRPYVCPSVCLPHDSSSKDAY